MELIKNLLTEYKKTIVTAIAGIILYFGRNYLPELFSPEMAEAVEIVISGIIIFLIGHFTRITNTEAKYLKETQ